MGVQIVMVNVKKFLICISFLAMVFLFSGAVSAANLTVNPGDSIQSTVNTASNNDIITVNDNNGTAYTYNENVVINKNVSLQAKTGASVTIQALNPLKPTILVNPLKNGVTIEGFTITGAESSNGIYLVGNSNCNIIGNNIINNYNGIYLIGSNNNLIQNNIIINNDNGINLGPPSNNNRIKNNTIINNTNGMNLGPLSLSNEIQSNTIINNNIGIKLNFASADINFNRITNNSAYGLYCMTLGTIDATNNWWGTNNPIKSSRKSSDIYVALGNVKYNPWLVLKVSANPSTVDNANSTVTADLTHNSNGNDTSSQNHIPDGLPVNFTTNLGTITAQAYTKNGKATTTFNRGIATSGIANINTTVDKQIIQINITINLIDTTPPTIIPDPAGGSFKTAQNINLAATDDYDPHPIIYYTIDGTDPTTSSTTYTKPIAINYTTTLKFIATDESGNISPVQTETYTIDNIPPTATTNPTGGLYNTTKNVTLTAADDTDPQPNIYYTTDGTDPQVYGIKYTDPITINKTTTLKYVATDLTGNWSPEYTETYTIDPNSPIVTANQKGGVYTETQTIEITATDDFDPQPTIYYTTDGTNPTTSSTIYSNPIDIITNTILKFIAVDSAGNLSPYQTEKYYFRIQDAIDDPSTTNGDIIEVHSGVYIENVVLNKKLTLKSIVGENVTIQALDWSPVITITSSGSGSKITGFNIIGGSEGIFLDSASNCTVNMNNISSNYDFGLYLENASNNTISENVISNNYYGICLDFSYDNIISSNVVKNNGDYGLYFDNSPENTLLNNVIENNWYNNLEISGSDVSDYVQYINTSNTINGSPIYYLIRQSDLILDGISIGYLSLISCDNIQVSSINIVDNEQNIILINTTNSVIENLSNNSVNAIYLWNSSYNTISGISTKKIHLISSNYNTITGNYIINNGGGVATALMTGVYASYSIFNDYGNSYAIYLDSSSHNAIINNSIHGNAICLELSPYNIISDNNLEGSWNYGSGIYLLLSPHNSISGNILSNYDNGIYLLSSPNNTISQNIVTSCTNGIKLENSSGNTLENNEFTNNMYGFGVIGDDLPQYIQDINITNTINGKPIYYLIEQSNLIFDRTQMGYLALISCYNIQIKNITITNNDKGLLLVNTINSTFEDCTLLNYSEYGVYLLNSSYNTFSRINIDFNGDYYYIPIGGVYLYYSSYNTISEAILDYNLIYLELSSYNSLINNTASETYLESSNNNNINGNYIANFISLSSSNDNIISENNALNINLYSCSNNVLFKNNITNNKSNGIYIESSSNNLISNNNITGNPDNYEYYYTDQCFGILLENSPNNAVVENNVYNQYRAIYLSNSPNNQITENNLKNYVPWYTSLGGISFAAALSYGISVDGFSTNNTFYQNIIDTYDFGFYIYSEGITNNNDILENNITQSFVGIVVDGSSENLISENNISDGTYGIYLGQFTSNLGCVNNTILGNDIFNNSFVGIRIVSSSGNNLTENTIYNNIAGIWLESSSNTTISGNTIDNNSVSIYSALETSLGDGISLESSSYNIITENIISNNSANGIYLDNSSNNNMITYNTVTGNGNNTCVDRLYGSNITYYISGIQVNGDNVTISGNTVNNNGINLTIDEYTINNYGGSGILVNGNNAIIINNIAMGNGLNAYLSGANVINNGSAGIVVIGDNAIVSGNNATGNGLDSYTGYLHIQDNSGVGINVIGNYASISGNTANNNQGNGILVTGDYNTISNNTANENEKNGIKITGNNSTLSGNTANDNESNGILLSGNYANISGNIANENTDNGISVTGNNTLISENTANNNLNNGILVTGDAATVSSNNANENEENGINIIGNTPNVSGNTANDNERKGILVSGNYATVSENVTNGNNNGMYVHGDGSIVSGNTAIGNIDIGITVYRNGTNISENTVINNGGDGIYITGNDAIIGPNNTVHDNDGNGLSVSGDNAQISGNSIIHNGGHGINVNGSNATVSDNTVNNNSRHGINSMGNDATVTGNTVTYNGAIGISIASGMNVSNNTVTNNNGSGISVTGDGVNVRENTAVGNGGDGINVIGNNAIITPDNNIHHNGGYGLYVIGNNIILTGFNIYDNGLDGIYAPGDNVIITDNVLTDNGGNGITVIGDYETVTGNTITNKGNTGISVIGNHAIVSGNTVRNSVTTGIWIVGDFATVTENTVINSGGDGILVSGLVSTISGNNVRDSSGNGISVIGDVASVINNVVDDNSGSGICISGFNANILLNTVTGNDDGIDVNGNNPRISNNEIQNNGGNGILVTGGGAIVSGNSAAYNTINGILVNGNNADISQNTVNNNGITEHFKPNTPQFNIPSYVNDINNFRIWLDGVLANALNDTFISGLGMTLPEYFLDIFRELLSMQLMGDYYSILNNIYGGNVETKLLSLTTNGNGIAVIGCNASVWENNANANGGFGIFGSGNTILVVNNTVTCNAGGIAISGNDIHLTRNNANDNDWVGIYVRSDKGSNVAPSSHIDYSTANNNGIGIAVYGAVYVVNCQANENIFDGILAVGDGWGDVSIIELPINQLLKNLRHGLYGNEVSNNGANGICSYGSNAMVLNHGDGNGLAGIMEYGDPLLLVPPNSVNGVIGSSMPPIAQLLELATITGVKSALEFVIEKLLEYEASYFLINN